MYQCSKKLVKYIKEYSCFDHSAVFPAHSMFTFDVYYYVIYHCSSARTTPEGVSLYQSLTFEENIVAIITQDRVMDDNLKRQIKNQTLCTCGLFLLT